VAGSGKTSGEIFYRVADAGANLDGEIEGRVAAVLRREPIPWRNPPSYSGDPNRARFLLDLAERREAAITKTVFSDPVWECSFFYQDGRAVVGRGETEALAICAAFMSERGRPRRRLRGRSRSMTKTIRRLRRRLWESRLGKRLRDSVRRLLFP